MPWVEVFAVLLVSHAAGDFLLQTNWQAANKHGGLGPDPERRRALLAHMTTYTLAFVPALIWLASDLGIAVVGIAAAIVVPHAIQDDQRVLARYALAVKGLDLDAFPLVAIWIDQAFHLVALFLVALLAAA